MSMSLVRLASRVTALNLVNAVIGFVGVIALTQLSTQTVIGQFFLFITVVSLSTIPAAAGVNGAVEKRISGGMSPAKVYSSALVLKLISLSITGLVIILLSDLVDSYIGVESAYLVVIAIIFQDTSRLTRRVLRGEGRVPAAIAMETTRVLLLYGGGALLLYNGGETYALIHVFIGGHVLTTLLSVGLQRTSIGYPNVESIKSILSYAKSNAVTSVGGMVYKRMDIAILGIYVAAPLIAAYEIVWRLSTVSTIVSTSVSISMFPKISEWQQKGKYDRIASAVETSLIPSLGFAVPIWVGGIALHTELLSVLYGQGYAVAGFSLVVILFERIWRALNNSISRCLHAIDRPELSARVTVAAIMTNLGLNLLLVPLYGIAGAAVATTISFVGKSIAEDRYLQQIIDIDYPLTEAFWIVVAATLMGVCIEFASRYISPESYLTLGVVVTIGFLIYASIVYVSTDFGERIASVTSF